MISNIRKIQLELRVEGEVTLRAADLASEDKDFALRANLRFAVRGSCSRPPALSRIPPELSLH
ncbi:hypothetical protein SDC9_36368 [bioreactor metagenome]|uniref:Uncharacterized protein n=1 Tax=bioreactor metagenome TaxID=1076179 RepID=A0A644VG97_9ZZZZ